MAARALCQFIQEEPLIDALMILSLPPVPPEAASAAAPKEPTKEEVAAWAKNSFGDEVAVILAENLPKNRFTMLQIVGGFGEVGLKAFGKNFTSLISPAPLDHRDISIMGMLETEEGDLELQKLNNQMKEFIEKRRADDPKSIVGKRDCIIM